MNTYWQSVNYLFLGKYFRCERKGTWVHRKYVWLRFFYGFSNDMKSIEGNDGNSGVSSEVSEKEFGFSAGAESVRAGSVGEESFSMYSTSSL